MTAPHSRLACWAALLVLAVAALPATAQDDDPLDDDPRARFKLGSHAFRYCLFKMGYSPLETFADLERDPSRSLLIVLGNPGPLNRLDGLQKFLERGGAVLLATSKETTGPLRQELLGVVGAYVNGERLLNKRENHNLGRPDRPFLTAHRRDTSWLMRGEAEEDHQVLRVATYLPSRLARTGRQPAGVERLAFLPDSCVREDGQLANGGAPPLFAVARQVGKGRILVLADSSVFLNALMLAQTPRSHEPATDNIPFTYNALAWLRGEEPHRDRALLVIDNQVETKFEVPLQKKPSLREIEAGAGKLADQTLYRLERRGEIGTFNHWIVDSLDMPVVTRITLLVLTLLLFIYLFYRFAFAAQYRQEPGVPMLARAVALQRPAGPLLEQRHRAMLIQGNLYSEAQGLARQFFLEALPDKAWPDKMPRVEARGGWWQRGARVRQLRRLWRLAEGTAPQPVGKAPWRRLLQELEELRAALADGSLRLHV